jgi:hypothetical protein
MRRGTIFIFLFILVAAGIIGASRFLASQPADEIHIAVDPLAGAWVKAAIADLNATDPVVSTRQIRFVVDEIDDLKVWNGRDRWTNENYSDAWIAASSASVQYALSDGLSLVEVTPSLARTPLVWGGYKSRVNALVGSGRLDWDTLTAADLNENWAALGGQSEWGFLKFGLAQPGSKIGGLAALFSAAAALGVSSVNDQQFRNQMLPVIKAVNFTTLGADPVGTMVGRGASVVEIGIFPEVQWLNSLSDERPGTDPIVLNYPAYQFVLDFPLVRWQNEQTPADRVAAVDMLNKWLLRPDYQAAAKRFGLRPATSEPTPNDDLFRSGVAFGIAYSPDFGQAVPAPSNTDVSGLIQWVATNS